MTIVLWVLGVAIAALLLGLVAMNGVLWWAKARNERKPREGMMIAGGFVLCVLIAVVMFELLKMTDVGV